MTTNAKRLLIAIVMAMAAIGFGEVVYALQPPHDSSKGVTCSSSSGGCHTRGGFKTRTSFDNLCFNTLIGCHRASPGIASKKRLSMLDASDRFGNISVLQRGMSGKKQSSHGWKIPNTNSNAGVTATRMLKESPRGPVGVKIFCTRCHRVMGYLNPKFLRASPTGNYICFNCHASRRIDNVREPLPSSVSFAGADGATITVAPHYSHPVEVNYSTARAKKPDFFEATPQLASVFGYKTSASVRLYTTHNTAAAPYGGSSRLAGTNKGAVVCQSCHGPIHSADSNPYTFDNLSAYSRLGQYSSSAGNLLRMYPIAGPKASDNLCKSCHKVKVHETNYPGLPANYFSCGRCHTPHKKAGEANRYLILENISTPFNGIRPVYFEYTTGMARRYSYYPGGFQANGKTYYGGYSENKPRLDKTRQVSSGICQVCHTRTKYQRNYSSPNHTRRGGAGTGHDLVYNDATGKYRFCPDCHMHTSSF
ncbi:MAG: hypothetical protein HY880_00475, partial [Deltaproteobacteria bacterium]|nr:hypothetical protein [Deltaproteobacteria bacterium]